MVNDGTEPVGLKLGIDIWQCLEMLLLITTEEGGKVPLTSSE